MLDRVRGEHLLARALEIGCHEGAFTEYLALAARKKQVGALRPGDHLLLGNVRGNEIFEAAHCSRYLVRGGIRISEIFAADHRLRLIFRQMDDLYVDPLFRRM